MKAEVVGEDVVITISSEEAVKFLQTYGLIPGMSYGNVRGDDVIRRMADTVNAGVEVVPPTVVVRNKETPVIEEVAEGFTPHVHSNENPKKEIAKTISVRTSR